jgi:hypothetical protein
VSVSTTTTVGDALSAIPTPTGLPLFGDFCNGAIQTQDCFYAAGLEQSSPKEYDINVATVVVNITQVSSATLSEM